MGLAHVMSNLKLIETISEIVLGKIDFIIISGGTAMLYPLFMQNTLLFCVQFISGKKRLSHWNKIPTYKHNNNRALGKGFFYNLISNLVRAVPRM